MTFGAFIGTRRKAAKLNLRDTAKYLGIAYGYLCDIEQGRRPAPEGQFVDRISSFLELDKQEHELLLDLAAESRQSVPADLPDYIRKHDIVRAALRVAKEVDAILELLGNMIEGNHIEAATVKPRHLPDSCIIYPIPVKLFNEEIQRSQFQAITPKAIQEYLYQGGFTLVNRGSLDYVASTGDGKSKQKCVCLYKEKMKDFVEQAGQEGPQA